MNVLLSLAVRHHDHLSLHLRAADHRPGPIVAVMQTSWMVTGRTTGMRLTQILRHAVPDQLRDRRGHRDRPGIPVRHELVGLLPLRRQRLRRAAGDGGAARVLPGVHVHRPVDLRLGQAAAASCTWPRSGWSPSGTSVSAFFILAANSWMQHPVGYRVDPQHPPRGLTSIVALLTNSTAAGRLAARGASRSFLVAAAWWSIAPAPGTWLAETRGPDVFRRAVRLACVTALAPGSRPSSPAIPGPAHVRKPAADEDGRGGGAVPHRNRRPVLAVHHRQPERRPIFEIRVPPCWADRRPVPRRHGGLQRQHPARYGAATTGPISLSRIGASG